MLERSRPEAVRVFWDVDAPATLAAMRRRRTIRCAGPCSRCRLHLWRRSVVRAYRGFGARVASPSTTGSTRRRISRAGGRAGRPRLFGNCLPDREARVHAFFLEAARRLPGHRFLLGGSGWMMSTCRPTWPGSATCERDHNAFNAAAAVLNIARDTWRKWASRRRRASSRRRGAGACLITDHWEGIEMFLEPGIEGAGGAGRGEVAAHLAAPIESGRRRSAGGRSRGCAGRTATTGRRRSTTCGGWWTTGGRSA
ncbi:MAG: hypothetical protein R3C69_18695 [Geminicoccaceae bacterium]